jgi:hypothetical protein
MGTVPLFERRLALTWPDEPLLFLGFGLRFLVGGLRFLVGGLIGLRFPVFSGELARQTLRSLFTLLLGAKEFLLPFLD